MKKAKEEKQVSTACHWPPGVNNPSQIDLPARPSRAFWINLKLISVPEVGKTCSGAYQKYSGAGRIWQGNLSQCTTGNGLWAPRVARGHVCCWHTHAHIHTHSFILCAPNTTTSEGSLVFSTERRVCTAHRHRSIKCSPAYKHTCCASITTHLEATSKTKTLSRHNMSIYLGGEVWGLEPLMTYIRFTVSSARLWELPEEPHNQ